jgi:L,D-transpeptidase YcbB
LRCTIARAFVRFNRPAGQRYEQRDIALWLGRIGLLDLSESRSKPAVSGMSTAMHDYVARIGTAVVSACVVLIIVTPALAADSSSCGARAATSAALAACKAAAAAALPAAVAAPAPVPAAAAPALTSNDDASGRPPRPDVAAGLTPGKKKKVAKRRSSDPIIASAPEAPATPEPNVFGALFGQPSDPSAAVASDPSATAATDPLNGGKLKGRGKKGVVTAKNSNPAAATAIDVPSGGFFGSEEAPFATGDLGYPLMSPGNIDPMKAAIKRYADIVASGGWPTVDPLQMQVGTTNPAVAALRQRLKMEGDLKGEPSGFSGPEYFDQDVAEALKRWQGRYGLGETGDLMDPDRLKNGTRTVMALNVPAEARLAQLKANLTRLQQKSVGKGRYVLVNIPGEQIEAIENNKVVLRLNGVVGRPERPSPLLTSNIADVKFNPVWNMPPTVLKEDLLPKAKALQAKGVDVLAKFGIDAYDGNGKKVDSSKIDWNKVNPDTYRYSEQPGKDNPLGFAKLDFASPEAVYMHDTPSNKLFDRSYRAASSGCIRVEHMDRLVTWLLKETDNWSRSAVTAIKESGESKIVHIKKSVPLHWVYVTAWATEDGAVHFRRDLYGKDQQFGVSKTASTY